VPKYEAVYEQFVSARPIGISRDLRLTLKDVRRRKESRLMPGKIEIDSRLRRVNWERWKKVRVGDQILDSS
jgi:hypothetical protein